jgi:hypothetical protein
MSNDLAPISTPESAAKARPRVKSPRGRAAVSVFVALTLVALFCSTSAAAKGKLRGFLSKASVDLTLAATTGNFTPVINNVFGSIQVKGGGFRILPKVESEVLNVERRGHTATRLQDGRVLIVGGENQSGPLSGSEIFDPATQTFSPGADAGAARTEHAAVRMNDGRIFIAGGRDQSGVLDSTELFDPSSASFTAGPSLTHARAGLAATLLADGRILVTGGDEEGTAEILDAQAQGVTALDETLNTVRLQHSALLLTSGKVLIASGVGPLGNTIQSGEIFDPADGSFALISGALSAPRTRPVLRELPNGFVQVIGGDSGGSMEIFVPEFDDFEAYAHLPATTPVADVLNARTRAPLFRGGQADASLDRSSHTITEIPQSNMALVAGGANGVGQTLQSVAVLASSAATVTTDKIDYGPGESVTISGTGFAPNETVTLTLHEEQAVHEDQTLTSVADAAGNFVNTDFVPETHHFGVTFLLTAKGGQSSFVAQTTFTDAATITTRVTLSPVFRSYGQLAPTIRVTFCQPLTDGTGRCIGINDKTIEFTVGGVAAGSVVTSTQLIGTVPTDGVAILPYDVLKNAGIYPILAKFAGDDLYKLSQGTANLTVGKVTQVIVTWQNPQAAITYGTPLSETQLNATIKDNTSASQFNGQEIPGVFAYTPAAGTVLTAGNSKSLRGDFTPTDTINYSTKAAFSTINVTKVPLTVTPNNVIRLYGEQNPTLDGILNGVLNGDNITAAYATTATPSSPAGVYDITATLSDPGNRLVNYVVTNNTGTLGVNKAALTITADNKAREYGSDNPAFTASYAGFVNNETQNTPGVLSALPSLTSMATATSPISTYPITFVGAVTAPNYTITFVDGTLTVSRATSVITLGNLTQTYDGTPKPVTVTTTPPNIEGLVVTYSGSTIPPTNAGSYAVVASLNNPNYNDAGKTGTLVINRAEQTINFLAIGDKTYGVAPFALSAEATSGLPVSFQVVSGNATVAGNVLTISGSGPVTIRASQGGDNNYNPAPDSTQTFNVAKAQATITLDPASLQQTYDGHAKHVSAVTNPAGVSGLSFSYTQNNTAINDPVNAGSYEVVASLTNPNVEAPNVTATMVIVKGGVTPAELGVTGGTYTYDALAHPATSSLVDANGKLLRVDFLYTPEAGTNPGADPSEPPLPPRVQEPQMRQVGPIDPNTGFPLWYEDDNGLRLALCLDNSPLCLTTLPDQTKPALVAPTEAESNFPDEAFWWSGESQFTANGVNVLVVMASEAAFASRIQTGDQMSFGRIRFRLDNLVAGGTYRITHPYGVDTFENVLPGRRGINFTEDIGIDNFPNGFLRSRIAPFLSWDTFGLTAAEGAPPTGFVGDPTVEHKVTGSPLVDASGRPQNYVRVERLDPVTKQVIQVVGESDLFTVSGKLSGLNVVSHPRSGPYNATGNSVRLLATNPQATIYYTTTTTTDGTAPADPSDPSDPANAARVRYTGPVALGTNDNLRTTIKFVAVDAAGNLSPVVSETYVFDPTFAGPTPHPTPVSQLKGVGPLNPATGFPLWYEDETGLRLQLCLDNSPLCLTTVPDQEHAAVVADHEADSNFIDEAFWWSGDAELTGTNGVTGRLTLASEAAFIARVQNGDQISFGRVRIRIDNLVAGGTYRITHPYGADTFENVAGGVRGINFTEDIGIDSFPDGAMRSRIAPFLKWDTYGQTPAAGGPPAGFIGDPSIEHKVTGSLLTDAGGRPQNYFRIERLDPVTKQVIEVVGETDLFAVSGKLVNKEVPPVYAGTYHVDASFAGNANLEPATATTQIVINKAEPTVDLTTDGTVEYDGNPHPASVSVSGIGEMRFVSPPVTITYTLVGTGETTTVPPTNAGTYNVTATFAGTKNYNAKTVTSQLVINQTTPVITWNAPADIAYGTPLGDEQLNAEASLGDVFPKGTYTYTPAAGTVLDKGTHTLSVTFVPVGNYQTATATVPINVINHAPVSSAEDISTDENRATTLTLASTDVDGNAMTFTLLSGPAHGTLNSGKPGWLDEQMCALTVGGGPQSCTVSAEYAPEADYSGEDSLTFKTTDTQDDSNVVTVKITIKPANRAPQVEAGEDSNTAEGSAYASKGSFTDPDDTEGWTAAVDYGDGTGVQPLALNADNTFGLSHIYDDNGAYTVNVTVTDKSGASASDTAVVIVSNVAPTPTITSPFVKIVEPAQPVTAETSTMQLATEEPEVMPADGEPDARMPIDPLPPNRLIRYLEGTQITFNSTIADPSQADTNAGFKYLWSVTKDGNPYSQSALSPTPGYTSYSFTPNDNGTYVVTLTVTDKDGGTGTASFNVGVNNVAPSATITGVPSKGFAGTPINLGSTSTDPSEIDANAGFKYLWSVTKNGNPYSQSAISPSAGMSNYSFTPDEGGTYVVTLSVTDKDGGTVSVSSTITVSSVENYDNFNDNSMDATKWYVAGAAGMTVAEQEGQLRVTTPGGTAVGYDGYYARPYLNLTNARATVEVAQAAIGYGTDTYFVLVDKATGGTTNVLFAVGGANSLLMRETFNGSITSQTTITYDAAQHRFWRFRHDPAADTLNWETSGDGLQWTVRHTSARRVALTKMQAQLYAGRYTTSTPSTVALFDNYRAEPNPPSPVVLGDDFNDNSTNTSKWTADIPAGMTVVEQNQRLEVTPPASAVGYGGYYSAANYDLTESRATVELVQSTVQNYGIETYYYLNDNSNGNYFMFATGGGNFLQQSMVNGVMTRTNIPFDPAQHRFLRFQHYWEDDTVAWETSADGVTWVTRRRIPRPFAINSMQVRMLAGKYTATTPASTAIFDNLSVERVRRSITPSDNFNDNSIDAARWQVLNPAAYVTVREQNQRIEMTLQPNTASYNGMFSLPQTDFWDKTLSVEIPQATNVGGAWAETYFRLMRNDSNYFHVVITGANTFVCDAVVNGVVDRTNFNYNGAAQRFWRFRHNAAAHTMNFEASADGTTWTTLKTVKVGFPLDNMRVFMTAGAWGTGNSTPGSAVFDNLRLEQNQYPEPTPVKTKPQPSPMLP